MSLESIQKEIQVSVDVLKNEIQQEFDDKIQKRNNILEAEYTAAKEKASKLIEKEEKERYIENSLICKMNERKRLLIAHQDLVSKVLSQVEHQLEELLGSEIYYRFIISHIQKYAQDGDKVFLSSKDFKNLGEKLKKEAGLNIKLDKKDNLISGVIIEKESFDYNFSTHSLIEEHYIEIENFLGKKLYE